MCIRDKQRDLWLEILTNVTTNIFDHQQQTPIITTCSTSNWTEPHNTFTFPDVLKKMQDVFADSDSHRAVTAADSWHIWQ